MVIFQVILAAVHDDNTYLDFLHDAEFAVRKNTRIVVSQSLLSKFQKEII